MAAAAANSSSSAAQAAALLEEQRLLLLALCERLKFTPIVYLGFLPLWTIACIYWAWSVYHGHSRHALDLHRLLLCVPTISMCYCGLSAGYYWTCPWDDRLSQIFGACQVVVAILKEPVMLVCLLMVAKGWGITRDKLSTKEMLVSSAIVGFLYMAVVTQFVLAHVLSVVPLLVMWLLMLINVIGSILTNLRYLKAQLLALRSFNIDATTTPAYTKYRMFQSLLASCVLYYILDVSPSGNRSRPPFSLATRAVLTTRCSSPVCGRSRCSSFSTLTSTCATGSYFPTGPSVSVARPLSWGPRCSSAMPSVRARSTPSSTRYSRWPSIWPGTCSHRSRRRGWISPRSGGTRPCPGRAQST